MNRPTGVTVLAILCFVGAVLCVLGGILFFVGGAFVGAIIASAMKQSGSGAAGAGLGAVVGGIVGVFCLFVAALDAACGYGLWNLKEWGRMLTIVLTAIGVVFGVIGLFGMMAHFNVVGMFFALMRVGVGVIIVWYLSQPHVKAAFAAPQVYAVR